MTDLFNSAPKLALRIYGSDGVELFPGDTVMVSNARSHARFYTKVCIADGRIYPIYGFSFDRIEKVDGVPDGAEQNKNDMCYPAPIYYVITSEGDERERLQDWIHEAIDMGEQRGPRFYRIEEQP